MIDALLACAAQTYLVKHTHLIPTLQALLQAMGAKKTWYSVNSIKYLMRKTNRSRRTIIYHLKELTELHLIRKQSRFRQGAQQTNLYRLGRRLIRFLKYVLNRKNAQKGPVQVKIIEPKLPPPPPGWEHVRSFTELKQMILAFS